MTDETSKPGEPDAKDAAAADDNLSAAATEPLTAETADSDSPQTPPADPPPSVVHSRASMSRTGLFGLMLAIIALLAVIGLGAAGYLLSQQLQQQSFAAEQDRADLHKNLAAVQVDNKGRSQWFDGMSERSSKRERQIEALQNAQQQDASRQSKLEASLSKLSEQVQGGQQAWQRAEIEHLLLVANTRLQLQKDLEGAQIALKLAQERLQSLADPAYFNVREQIANELTRLDAVQQPDVQALALKLASLTNQVDALPTRQTWRGHFDTDLKLTTGPEQQPWHKRLWVSMEQAVGSLISIRRDVERREPLLPPDQSFYLRQNLRLQLESARLALLRGDSANFKAALRQADDWMTQYFDTEHNATKAARKTINTLAGQVISVALPDISGSLKTLRSVGREA